MFVGYSVIRLHKEASQNSVVGSSQSLFSALVCRSAGVALPWAEGLVGFGSVPCVWGPGWRDSGCLGCVPLASRSRCTEDNRQRAMLGGIMRCLWDLGGEGHLYPVWPSKSHGQAQHGVRMGTLHTLSGDFHVICQKHGLVLLIWGGPGIESKDPVYPFHLCHIV